MKALVLSGEAGTRLWPRTRTSAERPVPVAHQAVRSHGLASIADAGLTHAGVIPGDTSVHTRETIDTEVHDPCTGPFTSVAENRRVVDSEAESSVALRDAPTEGTARAEASPAGPLARECPASSAPRAHHLVRGDGSKVQISS
jgi:hypothetical protein